MSSRAIGIFDSGLGGLTVFKEIRSLLPAENIIYLGDTAHLPFGNKSNSTVIKYSQDNVLFLIKKRVKLIVVACNTASAVALNYLKRAFSLPIVGVIKPAVEKALSLTRTKRIAVIGTETTIRSRRYEKLINRLNKNIKVFSLACPLFVPLVEEGLIRGKITSQVVEWYLRVLKNRRIDVFILGCTHYPLLKPEIEKYFLNNSKENFKFHLIDSAKEVAASVKDVLSKNNLLSKKKKLAGEQFYLTDKTENFLKLARIFLRRKISPPKLIAANV